jgi:APA family basic amino acid/polyamine antiporter
LLAFIIVCVGVWVLRRMHPEFPRAFKTPWVSFVAFTGAGLALVQMICLPLNTWLRLAIWMAVGLVIYSLYSRRHSRLHPQPPHAPTVQPSERSTAARN